jgi:transposase InsO family protein
VSELAANGIPVAVTCRVLNIARQVYYRWLAEPVTDAELNKAYRANALHDAHRDDPEFGYRYLHEEAAEAGQVMAARTAWRICSDNGWWSAFAKRRSKNGKRPGPPVHDDLVRRNFTATRPNELWLTDITEHWTAEGKLYLCAIKDVFSRRIVGYSIDSRMQSRLAVRALANAVARRQVEGASVDGCRVHSDRGSQFRSRKFLHALAPPRPGRVDGTCRCRWGQRGHGELLRTAAEQRPGPPPMVDPGGASDCDRDLDRADLPPPSSPEQSGPVDPHRVRDHHDLSGQPGRVT